MHPTAEKYLYPFVADNASKFRTNDAPGVGVANWQQIRALGDLPYREILVCLAATIAIFGARGFNGLLRM